MLRRKPLPTQYGKSQRGFALVLTLALLALLVLIMAGLAIHTRVEMRATDSSTRQAEARRNALLALDVAVAQLQKHAGFDARVTGTSAHLSGASHLHYTGIWASNQAGNEPITWLVSGNEAANPLSITPSATIAESVLLVGSGSANAESEVRVPMINIYSTDTSVPGVSGQYAWWVGDEGVKASLGLPDRVEQVDYELWSTPRRRARLRQQMAGTPSFFRNTASARFGFDPLTVALDRVQQRDQLQYFSPSFGSTSLDEFLRGRFHEFTDAAFGVLANTRSDAYAGLMRDLSVTPQALSNGLAVISDYANYMEPPASFAAIGDEDAIRRRYFIRPSQVSHSAAGLPALRFSVAPVLNEFLLQFKFTRAAANTVSVACRVYVGLWNPYTSALAPPEDLELEISGMPEVTIQSGTGAQSFDLSANLPASVAQGNILRMRLPFDVAPSPADRASWLPGRLYAWVTPPGAPSDNRLTFYNKNLNATGWLYTTTVAVPGGASDNLLGVSGPAVLNLIIRLKSGDETLAVYTAPSYQQIKQPLGTFQWKFGFGFRLPQPSSLDLDRSWLQSIDPRQDLGPNALREFDPNEAGQPNPNFYQTSGAAVTAQYLNQFLIFRSFGTTAASLSASNDVPVFELPRTPFVSVGELQHLQFVDQRPFALGNSWGAGLNSVFDRFFFSGLRVNVPLDKGRLKPLPNHNLYPVSDVTTSGAALTSDVLRDGGSGLTAKFLLQGGAFNINSVNRSAWQAVLSSLRFPVSSPFERAEIENDIPPSSATFGTQRAGAGGIVAESFDEDATLGTGSPGAVFFRFPQSAQETYDWNDGATNHAQVLTTQAYRLGARGVGEAEGTLHHLTADQIDALATRIAELTRERLAARGPFRSMEEFLGPNTQFGGKSLLEEAIASANVSSTDIVTNPINGPEVSPDGVSSPAHFGFSSLTLTQGDLMSALAPYLRTRSDTFIVRAYGATTNPATGKTEATAWLEAKVQRLPTPLNAGDDPIRPAGGRRFTIVSLRWLTSSEL